MLHYDISEYIMIDGRSISYGSWQCFQETISHTTYYLLLKIHKRVS